MADSSGFNPDAWAQQWVARGGQIDLDGLRWPFPTWLESERRAASDDLRQMLVSLTPEHGEALRTWALSLEALGDGN